MEEIKEIEEYENNWFDFCSNYVHLRAFRENSDIDRQQIVDFCKGMVEEAEELLQTNAPFYPKWEDEDEEEDGE